MTRKLIAGVLGTFIAVVAVSCATGTNNELSTGAGAGTTGGNGGTGGSGGNGTAGDGGGPMFDAGSPDADAECEECACTPGDTKECFTGPAEAKDVGLCKAGVSSCSIKGEFGTWGPCADEVLPATELCDAANLDEDCDGTANEGCECVAGSPPAPCGTDVGECAAGTQACVDGVLAACEGAVGPKPELCNNLDDDCDGTIDNGLTMECGTDVGACAPGTSTCVAGQWGQCTGGVGPGTELCNGIDDDCDGQTDEGLSQACGSDVGACSTGTQTCVNGQWSQCLGGVNPVAEACNGGVDDDCDGQVDEGCGCTNNQTQPCGTDVGACVAGTQTCVNGQWGACMGAVGPAAEACNNQDDDCDGQTDEGLTQACGTDTGACVAGTQTCVAGQWGPCTGAVGPVAESCNNQDDDCDGLKDESLTQQCGATSVGACEYGTQTCSNGNWGVCQGAVNAVPEICGNGIDEDCDGTADEAADCPQTPPIVTCSANITTQPLATVNVSGMGSDPDGGAVTYQWTVTQAPAGSSSQPATPNAASTAFFVDLAGTYVLTLTVTDNEGQTATCTVTITSIPPQELHVELVWNTAYGDADLHLIQAGVNPATAWYTIEPDCFFGNTSAAWPPNGGAGNASLDIDDTDGYGPENINILNAPQAGTYEIGVAYYCSHSVQGPGDPPPAPGDGPTTATVKVYCGGALIATYNNINLDKTGRFVDVASVTWPGCAGMTKNTATWTALVQPAAYSSPLHCTLPCSGNNDCGGGEKCQNGVCVLD